MLDVDDFSDDVIVDEVSDEECMWVVPACMDGWTNEWVEK